MGHLPPNGTRRPPERAKSPFLSARKGPFLAKARGFRLKMAVSAPRTVIPLPVPRCTISCKASRHSSLRHIWTDLMGNRRHEDYGGRRYGRYWEDHRRGIRPTPVFLPQNLSFLPPARGGARVFSALAPIIVSGSTLPGPLLSEGRWSRGLGGPQGWGVLILFPSHCQVES